jgi:hypothetical protein
VIDAEYYWVKTDELSWIDVRQLVDTAVRDMSFEFPPKL